MPSETTEDLGRNNFKIIQPCDGYRFSMDTVLLADFANVRKGDRVADLCAGAGALSLMLAAREESCNITAVEIDPYMADIARRNAEINGIADRMDVKATDVRDCAGALGRGAFSLVVCNPPYYDGRGDAAKHLTDLTLLDIARAASQLLPERARACFVYPAVRLTELAVALTSVKLEPKRLRCVQHAPDRAPKIVLIEAVKNARPALTWMPPLYTGELTDEMRAIYNLKA